MQKISAVIITKDEEKIIARCLDCLQWVDEIIVIDSGSTDNTMKIARQYGAKVYSREWAGYARQKNFGIAKAKNGWVLSLDADEIMTDELADEIKNIPDSGAGKAGFFIARKNIYYGRWLRFGGIYPDHQLRLFKKQAGKYDEVDLHECVGIKGETGTLKNPVMHYTKDSIHEHIEFVNKYTELEAKRLFEKGHIPTGYSALIKPKFYFLKHYIFKLGFLDGWQGFACHVISSMYVFMTEIKVMEKQGMGKIHLLKTLLKRTG
jgi:glycosyltransferase involved in cell wall biosynthesis